MTWIDIEDPDPEYTTEGDTRGVFLQGRAKGACLFNRLEGCWADGDSIYFVSTSGGDKKNGDVNADGYEEGYGQIWEYRQRDEQARPALRVPGRRRHGLAGQPHGHPPRRPAGVRGRRVRLQHASTSTA